jgi:hypothetical protein
MSVCAFGWQALHACKLLGDKALVITQNFFMSVKEFLPTHIQSLPDPFSTKYMKYNKHCASLFIPFPENRFLFYGCRVASWP